MECTALTIGNLSIFSTTGGNEAKIREIADLWAKLVGLYKNRKLINGIIVCACVENLRTEEGERHSLVCK